jgi:hypothetical protein
LYINGERLYRRNPMTHTEVKVAEFPICDICGKEAHYDAKSFDGRWGNFCDADWAVYTNKKLGLGLGQKLVLK